MNFRMLLTGTITPAILSMVVLWSLLRGMWLVAAVFFVLIIACLWISDKLADSDRPRRDTEEGTDDE